MNFRFIDDFQRDSIDVFIFPEPMREGAQPQTIMRYAPDVGWYSEPIGDVDGWTGRPKPSVSLPGDVITALLAFVRKERPTLDSEDAVKDARAMRDRLLALVETTVLDSTTQGLSELTTARRELGR